MLCRIVLIPQGCSLTCVCGVQHLGVPDYLGLEAVLTDVLRRPASYLGSAGSPLLL